MLSQSLGLHGCSRNIFSTTPSCLPWRLVPLPSPSTVTIRVGLALVLASHVPITATICQGHSPCHVLAIRDLYSLQATGWYY